MEELKLAGNDLFQKKEYEKALSKYREAIENVDENDEKNLSILHSNISATLSKLERYNEALEHAVASTRNRPEWFKAWYRLSMVLYKLEKYEQAERSIEKSLECCKKDNVEQKFVTDLKKDILKKLNNKEENQDQENLDYKILDEAVNSEPPPNMNIPNLNNMMPMMSDVLKNEKIKSKLGDKNFQEKILRSQSNPLEMLNDPDMRDLMSEMMKNINLNK